MAILGIEIGSTKLQLGLSNEPHSELVELRRRNIEPAQGARGILEQIAEELAVLTAHHRIDAIGVGFGGPVRPEAGTVTVSHQVPGWNDFPLCEWLRQRCPVPVALGNDCDVAALAEARFGAGRAFRSMFYVTVGTGIGGGFVFAGDIFGADRPAVAEIGQLRPTLDPTGRTVEDWASGWGIARRARQKIAERPDAAEARELHKVATGHLEQLTSVDVAAAARAGNALAREVLQDATDVLGWGIAQMMTLLAPELVVVGGGVAQLEAELFWKPLRGAVARHGFGPLRDSCSLVPAVLGDQVVVRGAVALGAETAAG